MTEEARFLPKFAPFETTDDTHDSEPMSLGRTAEPTPINAFHENQHAGEPWSRKSSALGRKPSQPTPPVIVEPDIQPVDSAEPLIPVVFDLLDGQEIVVQEVTASQIMEILTPPVNHGAPFARRADNSRNGLKGPGRYSHKSGRTNF